MTLKYRIIAEIGGALLHDMPKVDRDFREGDIFEINEVVYKVESVVTKFTTHEGIVPGYDQPVAEVKVSLVP